MTHLSAFSDCVMLMYGMDGDLEWARRQTRFMSEVYAGDTLDVRYRVASKKDGEGTRGYEMLHVDYKPLREGCRRIERHNCTG